MKIINKIKKIENLITEIQEKSNENSVVLFGDDDITMKGKKICKKLDINIKDIINAKDFAYKKNDIKDCDVIICNRKPFESFEFLNGKINTNIYFYDLFGVDQCTFDYNFVLANLIKIQKVYEMLNDELSKEIYVEYINSKISGDFHNLLKYETYGQYIEKSVVDISKYDVICDCGSYDGLDISKFNKTSNNKDLKIIALEPDENNYIKIKGILEKETINNVEVLNVGAWKEKKNMKFCENENGSCSQILDTGDKIIKVDKIDNIFEDYKCDYIKMDIEGAELEALEGAKETILKNKSDLAICIYHKKEDVFKIPLFIENLGIDYNYVIRLYNKYSIELVLYAIKK